MTDAPRTFKSKLPQGWQRFLAHVIEDGIEGGRRDPTDFIRHFPPAAIMQGLASKATLRANILVICTGTRMRIALKKTAESCAEDLQISLDEDETDAETVVTLFDPDDRIRYLDKQKLWEYVTEGEFWKADAKDSKVAAAHVAFILERALTDELVTHREVIEGISTERLAELLPRKELHEILAAAFDAAHTGKPFSEQKMLAITPPAALVNTIPLADLWEKIVVPQIASRHKLSTYSPPKPPAVANSALTGDDIDGLGDLDGDLVDLDGDLVGVGDGDLDMDIDDVLDMSTELEDDKKNDKSVNPPTN